MRTHIISTWIIIVFCLCLFLLPSVISKIIVNRTPLSYLYFIDSKGMHRLDTTSNEKKVVFNTEGLYEVSFSLSPSDTVIALLVTKEGVTLPGEHDYSVLPRNSVIFITPEGKEVAKLEEDVREFSWSPDGEKIAYITGTYYEGGVGFKTTGVWIFDLKNQSKKQIKKDFPHPSLRGFEGGGYEIKWAKHDNNIYIKDFDYCGGIYRYDTKLGISEQVKYKDINFSPDGKFYISEQFGDSIPQRLYISDSNLEITDRLKKRFGYDIQNASFYWVFQKSHLMHLIKKQIVTKIGKKAKVKVATAANQAPAAYNVIYDVEKDKVLKEVTLPTSRWKGNPGEVVLEKEGKIFIETYEDIYKE